MTYPGFRTLGFATGFARASGLCAAILLAAPLVPSVLFAAPPPEGSGGIAKFWDVPRNCEALTREYKPFPGFIDWDSPDAEEIGPGTKMLVYETTTNSAAPVGNLNKWWFVRVDLTTPGLMMAGPGRCNIWGQPMTDVDTPAKAYTLRERTTDFMARQRGAVADGGLNRELFLAFNSEAWGPWSTENDMKSVYGNPNNPLYSDGIQISASGTATVDNGIFVFYKDGTADFVQTIDDTNRDVVWHSLRSFVYRLVRDGEVVPNGDGSQAQRNSIGLSRDRKTLYLVTADGRQKNTWSAGPTFTELAFMQRAAGAWDAMNLDGGGSTSLVYWDAKGGKITTANRNGGIRRNGCNSGFYIYAVRVGTAQYRSVGDYLAVAADGDEVRIVRDVVLDQASFPHSCRVTAAAGASIGWAEDVRPTVASGTRIEFADIAFAPSSRTLFVADGGTAAVSGDCLDKVCAATANGFELSGAISRELAVECAGADKPGAVFGFTRLPRAVAEQSLPFLRNPASVKLSATLVPADNGFSLVWR